MSKVDKIFNYIILPMFVVSFMFVVLIASDQKQARVDKIEYLNKELSCLRQEIRQYKMEGHLEEQTKPFIEKTMTVTAYCPCERCCQQFSDGQTATGTNAYERGVAVDPKFITYGSMVFIPEYGYVMADDCGGAIKGNRLDVRFSTHQEALNWGVRILKVRIYPKKEK